MMRMKKNKMQKTHKIKNKIGKTHKKIFNLNKQITNTKNLILINKN